MRTGKILLLVASLFFVYCQVSIAQKLSDFLFDVSDLLDFTREGVGSDTVAGAAWFDYNNDNFLDLFICNAIGAPNALFRNNGNATFTDVAGEAGVSNGLGNAGVIAGDINNDGCADIFLSGAGGIGGTNQSDNKLFLNNYDSTFSDITDQSGVPGAETSLSAAFGDVNNDGFIDLFITSPVACCLRCNMKIDST